MTARSPAADELALDSLIDLRGLSAGIRWRRRLWCLMALAGAVLGATLPVLLPSASASTIVYVVHPTSDVSGDSAMKTDLAVLQTTSVAADAVARLRIDTPPEKFVSTYSGAELSGNVMQITAAGPTRDEALNRAKAVAEAFIAQLVKRSDDDVKAEVDALNRRADEVRRELADVNAQIESDPAAAPPELQDRRTTLTTQASTLDQRAEEAKVGYPRVVAGTQIIDAPRVTSRSASASIVVYGVVGTIAGLGIGLVIAAIGAVVRDRPVLRRDIAAHLGASVIAQVPAPPLGPSRLWKKSGTEEEYRRTAATLTRAVRGGGGPVSLLELGCAKTAARLTLEIAEELAASGPVTVVDDLPGGELADAQPDPDAEITIVQGAEFAGLPTKGVRPEEHWLAVGTVGPGTPWTDLRRLGAETLLVVRAGRVEVAWLHTVARQLADAPIAVIGVVVVHPDPRDRSDGTLWDALNTAVRGRLGAADALPRDREVPAAKVAGNGHRPVEAAALGDGTAATLALAPVGATVGAAPAVHPMPGGATGNGVAGDANGVLPAVHATIPLLPVNPARPVTSPPPAASPPDARTPVTPSDTRTPVPPPDARTPVAPSVPPAAAPPAAPATPAKPPVPHPATPAKPPIVQPVAPATPPPPPVAQPATPTATPPQPPTVTPPQPRTVTPPQPRTVTPPQPRTVTPPQPPAVTPPQPTATPPQPLAVTPPPTGSPAVPPPAAQPPAGPAEPSAAGPECPAEPEPVPPPADEPPARSRPARPRPRPRLSSTPLPAPQDDGKDRS